MRTLNQSMSELIQNQYNSLITVDTELKTALYSVRIIYNSLVGVCHLEICTNNEISFNKSLFKCHV